MNDELKAYDHQVTTTDFILNNPRCLITSDPGTGKTRSVLDAFVKRPGKMLVSSTTIYIRSCLGR